MQYISEDEKVIRGSKAQWDLSDFNIGDIVGTLDTATYKFGCKGKVINVAFDHGSLHFLVDYEWENPKSFNKHWERLGDIGKVVKV